MVKYISRTIVDTFGTVLASNSQRTFTDVAATVVNRTVSSILAWSQRTGVWWKRVYLHWILFLFIYLFIYFFTKIFTFYCTVTSNLFPLSMQGFWYFARSRSREIHKNSQNTAKFGKNLIKYMSVQQFWNLSQILGVFTCRKLANLCQNFVAETCKQLSETTRRNYVAKTWALAMMLKALPLVHFWSVLLLKEQMMTSVRKTLKTLVWSARNRSISSEICPENNHKIRRFLLIAFRPSLPREFLRNRPIFPRCSP